MIDTVITIIISLFIFSAAYAGWQTAPWAPTTSGDIKRFLKLAKIKPGDKFYDLGCGDGRLLCSAARVGARAEGFEISLLPYLLSRLSILFQKDTGLTKIKYKDFWRVNLNDADIVYFFLTEKIIPKLKAKFERELKNGTKVISYVWPIDGWEPAMVDIAEGRPNLYLYWFQQN